MKVARFPAKHPLCTCPDVTWSNLNVDRSQCAGGRVAHPVLDTDKARRLIDDFHNRLRPEQFGTSMHYPYCQDRNCTGCVPPLPAPDPAQDPFGLCR